MLAIGKHDATRGGEAGCGQGKEFHNMGGDDVHLATLVEEDGDRVVRNSGSGRKEVFTLTPGGFGFER